MRSRTRGVVRPVVAVDPAPHLVDGELAVVDRPAVVERAPDERLAEPRLAARHELARPAAAFEQREVDVAGVAVRVDVGARRARRDQADAALGGRQVELVDEAVLAVAQVEFAQRRAEVGREGEARVRRVEDQRPRGAAGPWNERRGEAGGHRHSIDRAAGAASRRVG